MLQFYNIDSALDISFSPGSMVPVELLVLTFKLNWQEEEKPPLEQMTQKDVMKFPIYGR
jgi:hypothetical protein